MNSITEETLEQLILEYNNRRETLMVEKRTAPMLDKFRIAGKIEGLEIAINGIERLLGREESF